MTKSRERERLLSQARATRGASGKYIFATERGNQTANRAIRRREQSGGKAILHSIAIGYLVVSLDDDVVVLVDDALQAPFSEQRPGDDLQIVLAVVPLARREEGQVEIAVVVVDGTAAAVPPRQGDPSLLGRLDVALLPRILVAAEHHAGIVSPEQQHVTIGEVVVAVEPVLQRQISEHIRGLRYEY